MTIVINNEMNRIKPDSVISAVALNISFTVLCIMVQGHVSLLIKTTDLKPIRQFQL